MLSLGQVTASLRRELPRLRAQYGLCSLAVFGSVARSEHGPESDVDLVASFSETPSLLRLLEVENDLADTLGNRVDLVLEDGLKPRIARSLSRELVPV
jgi:uncharacterized protein